LRTRFTTESPALQGGDEVRCFLSARGIEHPAEVTIMSCLRLGFISVGNLEKPKTQKHLSNPSAI